MGRASLIIPYMGILSILMFTMSWRSADAAVGYDCGSRIQNMTTMSLLDIDDCDLKIDNVEESTEQIALLQLNEFENVKISQCKVEISRTINYCDSFSTHIRSLVEHFPYISYIEKTSRADCENALISGSMKVRGANIAELAIGERVTRSLTFAGSISSNGACSGAHYEDRYGSWDGVTVAGAAHVTVNSKTAKVKLDDDKIFLPSGYSCKFSKGECIDPVGGYTFWDTVPREKCNSHSYSLLYKGAATKLVSNEEAVYTVNVDATSFSFTVGRSQSSCNVSLLTTESPKLFIVDSNNLNHLGKIITGVINVDNMDIFLYANSKFVYVEKHIRSQVKSLYSEVMRHFCKLEKEILKNTLAILSTQPDEFAFRYMEGPGYMAVLAGEVVHIVQCVPVEVTYRHVDKCYNRLPIKRDDQSLFLIPRTHILTKNANQIPCNLPLLEHYKLEGRWYKLAPKPMNTNEPMKPSSEMTWTYENPADLLASGIYRQTDLDAMQERIMNPMETKVQTATLSQQISNGMQGTVDVKSFLLGYVQNDLFPDIWSLIWGPFSWFGSVTAGLVGVFMIFKMIKFVMDIIVNAYILYTKYGWSYRIFGAVLISLTNLSLFRPKKENPTRSDTIDLQSIGSPLGGAVRLRRKQNGSLE